MSRIAPIVRHTTVDLRTRAQRACREAANDLHKWLARFESDRQCDDEDRKAIAEGYETLTILTRVAGEI